MHVSTWAGNVSRLWSFFQCALDLRGSVGFFPRGILRLSSIIFYSPFECDVIQLNVHSGPRWACLLYVHEHDRLGFGMLSVETAVFNPRAVFDCICGFSSNCDRSGRILFAVFGISGRVLWRKDPAFALKYHYKSMWQYLARNLKADVNFLVLLNLWVYGNWRRHATQPSIIRLAWPLCLKYLSVKPRLLMKKGWFLEVENLRVS